MFGKIIDAIVDHFKEKPYWNKLQPVFILIGIYFFALAVAYKFLGWRYQISPRFLDFARSYIFLEISLVLIAVAIILLLFELQDRLSKKQKEENSGKFSQGNLRRVLKRVAIVGIVLMFLVPAFTFVLPSKASNVRIIFLEEPEFDKYAFLYIMYELNRLQRSWRFKVDLDLFNETELDVMDRKRCSGIRDKAMCYARVTYQGKPLIAITSESFEQNFFWQNQGEASVISTFRWKEFYAPPSIYEYLAYSVIAQTITIHLNEHGESLMRRKNAYYGDWLEFASRRNAIRAEILAAHLSRDGENLLMNCFGAEYMTTTSKLLRLDWLRSERVIKNLEKHFNVKL
jgi:uncharacterized membrane protein